MAFRILLISFGLAQLSPGQAVLEPPFGLKWADSPEGLIDWAREHTLDVNIGIPGAAPEQRLIRVNREDGPLPGSTARAVEARFQAGRLYEVTVHYGDASESVQVVERQFNELRRRLGIEHGKLTANQQNRTVEDGFATRTVSFHREPVRGLFLLLALTEVEDILREDREATFSLIYRNDNLKKRIEAEVMDLRSGE